MARIKKVFSDKKQCAHVWAQQTQQEGSCGNLFFYGTKIYSYGRHFTAGQIHTVNGWEFALVNSHRYSVSTGRHLSYVRAALRGLVPYFECSDPADYKKAVKELDAAVKTEIARALKIIKIEQKLSIEYSLERINFVQNEANDLRRLLGLAEKEVPKKDLEAVKTHLEFRLKRYRELNTPAMIAKREKIREQRKAAAAKKIQKDLADKIQEFRKGQIIPSILRDLPFDILRVNGDTITTSRGAHVPLAHAKLLYRALKAGKDICGRHVGSFTVNEVTEYPDYTLICVGCRRLQLHEIKAVLDNV